MNRPPVENTRCHHECVNRIMIIKKAPQGDTEIIIPIVVNVNVFSLYDRHRPGTQVEDYNQWLKTEVQVYQW